MMSYTIEEIYKLVGRDDKVAVLNFYPESKACYDYGESITLVFVYDMPERDALEKKYKEGIVEENYGLLKAKYLGVELKDDKRTSLLKEGINSKEIMSIFPSPWSGNLYHSAEKRNMRNITIPIVKASKGGDYDWIYGFMKKMVTEGAIFYPYERELYLALKKFYEEENISEAESQEMLVNGILKPEIEKHFLELKIEREVSNAEEEKRFEELSIAFMNKNLSILKDELQNAGTNFPKLFNANVGLARHLIKGTYKYNPHRINGFKGKPIYMDWKSYLHVFLRHVEEFKVSSTYDSKSKLLWNPQDVIPVIEKVIGSVDAEIQEFWTSNPNTRFSKYGSQSLYFEGDYYTFHIESEGRLSTFHRSDKNKGN